MHSVKTDSAAVRSANNIWHKKFQIDILMTGVVSENDSGELTAMISSTVFLHFVFFECLNLKSIFYRAMLRRVRLWHSILSVRPSVRDVQIP